jgi:hypothetical protein
MRAALVLVAAIAAIHPSSVAAADLTAPANIISPASSSFSRAWRSLRLGEAAPFTRREMLDIQTPAPRVAAFEYSDAYKTRAKIHKYASFATLPLFATEVVLGQSTYSSPSDGKKAAHIAVGSAIIGLFAVNTVTGVWNLWEARQDPHGRNLRLIHGLLMIAANAGFVATAALAPGDEGHEGHGSASFSDQRSTHRAVALTSIGIGTAGYLVMLFGGK